MASAIAERFRHAVNRNPVGTGVVLLTMLAAVLLYSAYSVGYLGRTAGPDLATMKAFFMDEETGEIEIRLASEIPPLTGKSGQPTVVLARFFTATTDDARKLIYLERYTPEGKQAKEATRNGRPPTMEEMEALRRGTQVRFPERNSPWVFVDTPQGHAVLNAVSALAPDVNKVRAVFPK